MSLDKLERLAARSASPGKASGSCTRGLQVIPHMVLWRQVVAWTVETLDHRVDAELEELPEDMRARFVRISELIEEFGLPRVKEPYIGRVRQTLWEIRLRGRSGIARALYVTTCGERVIVVRVFVKKTETTPDREIVLALQRAREVER
jgi:phage-related protein